MFLNKLKRCLALFLTDFFIDFSESFSELLCSFLQIFKFFFYLTVSGYQIQHYQQSMSPIAKMEIAIAIPIPIFIKNWDRDPDPDPDRH